MNRSHLPWRIEAAHFVLILALATGVAGCRKPVVALVDAAMPAQRIRPSLTEPVFDVVRAQVDALNREDLDGSIAHLDRAGARAREARAVLEKAFSEYDLQYRLESLAIEDLTENEARVRFIQVTEKIDGPSFRNNRTEGIHVLKRRGDEWKISKTETDQGRVSGVRNKAGVGVEIELGLPSVPWEASIDLHSKHLRVTLGRLFPHRKRTG